MTRYRIRTRRRGLVDRYSESYLMLPLLRPESLRLPKKRADQESCPKPDRRDLRYAIESARILEGVVESIRGRC